MPIMNSVMGGVGAGVQPKDNPNPTQSGPDAAAQTADNSLPQSAPQQPQGQPQPQPSAPPAAPAPQPGQTPPQTPPAAPPDKSDPDLDSLLKNLSDTPQPKSVKKAQQDKSDDLDGLLSQAKGVDQTQDGVVNERKPGQSLWDYASSSLSQQAKFIGAKVRPALQGDPSKVKDSFVQMYGQDNVKDTDKGFSFRPSSKDKWRSADQNAYGEWTDYALLNVLKALPTAANIGGMAGTVAGAPATGGLSLAAAGAAGGAADAVTKNAMLGGISAMSANPTPADQQVDQIRKDILKDAGLGALFGPIAAVASKVGTSVIARAAEPVIDSFVGQGMRDYAEFSGKFSQYPNDAQKLASTVVAWKGLKNALGLGDQARTQAGVGQYAAGAVESIEQRLGSAVGAVKDEAINLSKQAGDYVNVDGTMGEIKKRLSDNFYVNQENGLLVKKVETPVNEVSLSGQIGEKTFTPNKEAVEEKSYLSTQNQLADYYNKLRGRILGTQSEIPFPGGMPTSDGGVALEEHLNDIDGLSRNAKYSQDKTTDAQYLFQRVRNAAGQDRNAYIDKLYSANPDATYATTWKDKYSQYASDHDAALTVLEKFHDDATRAGMVKTLSGPVTPQKTDLLQSMKQVLGESSKEWGSVRGELLDNVIDRNIGADGILNVPSVQRTLTQKQNQDFIGEILKPQEVGVVNKMLNESRKVYSGLGIKEANMENIKNGAHVLLDATGKPGLFARLFMKSINNDADISDYMCQKGFLEMAEAATGAQAKQRIMQAMSMTENAVNRMQIINVKTPGEKATSAAIRRYVPFLGAGNKLAADKLMGGSVTAPFTPDPSDAQAAPSQDQAPQQ